MLASEPECVHGISLYRVVPCPTCWALAIAEARARGSRQVTMRAAGEPGGAWGNVSKRSAVMMRDRSTCRYCGSHGNTIDHVIPRTQGGGNEIGNLVACCKPCNAAKGGRTPEQAGMKLLPPPSQRMEAPADDRLSAAA